jgi:hypothetical protein
MRGEVSEAAAIGVIVALELANGEQNLIETKGQVVEAGGGSAHFGVKRKLAGVWVWAWRPTLQPTRDETAALLQLQRVDEATRRWRVNRIANLSSIKKPPTYF